VTDIITLRVLPLLCLIAVLAAIVSFVHEGWKGMGDLPKTQKLVMFVRLPFQLATVPAVLVSIAFIFDPDDWNNMKIFKVWIGAISYLALELLVRHWEKRRGAMLGFPRTPKVVREALSSMEKFEQSLPQRLGLGPELGFKAIRTHLREFLASDPDGLQRAAQEHGNSIDTVVLIVARNIVWDELASGRHMTWGTRKTMSGDGLVSLFDVLSTQLEKAGVETAENARKNLNQMIEHRHGY
jgi:hypothetical protein